MKCNIKVMAYPKCLLGQVYLIKLIKGYFAFVHKIIIEDYQIPRGQSLTY